MTTRMVTSWAQWLVPGKKAPQMIKICERVELLCSGCMLHSPKLMLRMLTDLRYSHSRGPAANSRCPRRYMSLLLRLGQSKWARHVVHIWLPLEQNPILESLIYLTTTVGHTATHTCEASNEQESIPWYPSLLGYMIKSHPPFPLLLPHGFAWTWSLVAGAVSLPPCHGHRDP